MGGETGLLVRASEQDERAKNAETSVKCECREEPHVGLKKCKHTQKVHRQ